MSDKTIDRKAYLTLLKQVLDFKLETLAAPLLVHAQRINPENPSKLDLEIWPKVEKALTALIEPCLLKGSPDIPAHLLPTGLPVGMYKDHLGNVSDGGHFLLVGMAGSGKTSLMQRFNLAQYKAGRILNIFDNKFDSLFWLVKDPNFLRLDGQAKWNMLQRKPWRDVKQHVADTVELWRKFFYGGEVSMGVWQAHFEDAFTRYEQPSYADVLAIAKSRQPKGGSFTLIDASAGFINRLERLRLRWPVSFSTKSGITIDELLTKHVWLDASSMDGIAEFATFLQLDLVHQHHKNAGIREVSHAICLDESTATVDKAHARSSITGVNPIPLFATQSREHGMRMAIAIHDAASADPLLFQSVSTIALMPGIADDLSLRRFGLNPRQAAAIKHMTIGQCALLYPAVLAWPIIIDFPPLPPGLKDLRPVNIEPSVDDVPALPVAAPPQSSPPTALATAELIPPLPPPTKPAPTAAASEEPPPCIVNLHEAMLIDRLATDVILPTRALYDAVGIHYTAGNAANKLLQKKGLVKAGPITLHHGSGSYGIGLMLTPEGKKLARVPLSKQSNGVGFQSAYLTHGLARLLDANIDVDCGGKAPDLLLVFNKAKHSRFLEILADHGRWLNGVTPEIAEGSLCAIEIDRTAATVENNWVKDSAREIPTLVFATMPKSLKAVTQQLLILTKGAGNVNVIDALILLQELRKETNPS